MADFDSEKLASQSPAERAHVLTFTSGKGGVGKTCITTNVAVAMVQKGVKVCIFDADTGLANVNILLGLRPEYTLEHVLRGEKSLDDIIIYTDDGLAVLPGATGIAECANLDRQAAKRLIDALAELESKFDYLLVDTAAGIADNVIQFIESASCTFLVITSEPTSLTDGFSLLKLLNSRDYQGRLRVVVNQAVDYPSATETFRRFSTAVDKYLQINIDFGGFIARDEWVAKSIAKQTPLLDMASNTPATRCLHALAENVIKYIGSNEANGGFSDYWKNLLAELPPAKIHEPFPAAVIPDTSFAKTLTTAVQAQATATVFSDVELTQKLLANLKRGEVDRGRMEGFVGEFIAGYVERFGSYPQTFKQLFYRWLEAENYSPARMIELVATLESLYVSKHQQPMFGVEDSAARLVAQAQGSENKLRGLIDQLRGAYRQAFHRDAFDPQQELVDSIQRDDFSEERFEHLLNALHQAFQKRFSRPYRGQSDLLLETTSEALSALAHDEQQLELELGLLTDRFQQLNTRRDALLSAIEHAQNGNALLKSRIGEQR